MSTLQTADRRPQVESTSSEQRQATLPRAIRAEWIKLTSVRSNLVWLGVTGILAVFFGVVFSSLAEGPGGPAGDASDPLSLSMAGFNIGQIIVAVVACLFVTTEYSTGLIRTMFAAIGRRLPVLWAKAIAFTALAAPIILLATFLAFLAGQAVYGGEQASLSLGDDGTIRALFGKACYVTAVGLIGIALGFILRSGTVSIGILFVSLFILPNLIALLPDSINGIGKLLPSAGGDAMSSVVDRSELLSPAQGAIVLTTWVVGLMVVAAFSLIKRDA